MEYFGQAIKGLWKNRAHLRFFCTVFLVGQESHQVSGALDPLRRALTRAVRIHKVGLTNGPDRNPSLHVLQENGQIGLTRVILLGAQRACQPGPIQ